MATAPHMDFERDIVDIQEQIEVLLDTARGRGFDVSDELRVLRKKLDVLKEETYRNLSPIEQVQVARHPQRPYTLDYVEDAREQGSTGKLEADDVVYDNESQRGTDTEVTRESAVEAQSAEKWMRSVDTETADFLRSRFLLEAAREDLL